jgi:type II secretory pathway pseudopilin PulG
VAGAPPRFGAVARPDSKALFMINQQRNNSARPRRVPQRRPRGAGFTVIEILIVVAIIIVLLSILVVAVSGAARTGQTAKTRQLMTSIGTALEHFKSEIGYIPPILDQARALVPPPNIGPLTAGDPLSDPLQDFFSVTSLPEYLIGYGNHAQDGHGIVGPGIFASETPKWGIRTPGTDGVWGATVYGAADGSLAARNLGNNPNFDFGQVYGPYLDTRDTRMIGTIDGAGVVRTPDDAGYDLDNPLQSAVILDHWGRPIRFYRRDYIPGALNTPNRNASLAEVALLRPYKVEGASDVDALTKDDNGTIDDFTASFELKSAEYALFSSGPDKKFNPRIRFDAPEEFNADNIVEVGP